MRITGAKRTCGRLGTTAVLLLMLAATAAGADSFGFDGDSASAAASQFPMPAADIVTGVGEMATMSDAPIIRAAAVAIDRSTKSPRDGDAPVGQNDEAPTFLDQLVTQYFESYN